MRTLLNSSICALLALLIFSVAGAQTARQPVSAAAKPATDAPMDLSGVWTAAPPARPVDPKLFGVGRKETIPPDKDEADITTFRHSPYPMQPWAEEKFNYNRDPVNPYYRGRNELDTFVTQCAPEGPTVKWLDMNPFEIIQSAKRILILFESNHEIRQIWIDGRQHPKDWGHNWMGHSIGHWEGDTLVIDTIGVNDLTWLDKSGHVHSDQLHLIERLQRVNDKLSLAITFDDPKAFTMPWSARKNFVLKPGWELEEAPTCGDEFVGAGVPLR
jgi:hypothetical protein